MHNIISINYYSEKMIKRKTKHLTHCIAFLFVLLVLSSFIRDNSVSSVGNVSFTVRTVTCNGSRSPKNIVAIWIPDFADDKQLSVYDLSGREAV